ncbi:zinc ribbon domain-containing protein [Saccharopolyspora spinosa]|uniref:zinc ribbon domain-containing protein n=1 Tax=Saccharopolyspora spinosa TaxID=60894 RepID=UPI00192B1943
MIDVDAANTSQHCPRCRDTERANRTTRDDFLCRRCGLAGPADVVAGVNVRDRARPAWVFVKHVPTARSFMAEYWTGSATPPGCGCVRPRRPGGRRAPGRPG